MPVQPLFTCLGRHLEVELKSAPGSEPPRPIIADEAGSQADLGDSLKERPTKVPLEQKSPGKLDCWETRVRRWQSDTCKVDSAGTLHSLTRLQTWG